MPRRKLPDSTISLTTYHLSHQAPSQPYIDPDLIDLDDLPPLDLGDFLDTLPSTVYKPFPGSDLYSKRDVDTE
ncbi:hypothetical protein ElyMa_006282100 [Elysia marginata]|uniref:AGC-kinase C-terminal domain-containing protein n=1 Tax=Elysia marginata TaxID=1093978 RepID=A0AAV4HGE2_9GAST|nr:hypothetical protein ElyMa_006282100 [Elysia marginata]